MKDVWPSSGLILWADDKNKLYTHTGLNSQISNGVIPKRLYKLTANDS